jgi:hypothetical protein
LRRNFGLCDVTANNALHLPPESYLSRLLQPDLHLHSQQARQILGCKLA